MLVTQSSEWGQIISSVADGTQPAAAWGTSLTPGNNTYGSYAQVLAGASLTSDAFGILVNFNSNSVSTAARDTIVTIGLDAAGGTSFTDFISDLLCSGASAYVSGVGTGVWYYFPVFVKSGTSIGAKASVNNATVGTLRCAVTLFCKPSRPEMIRYGSYVTTFGSTAASSCGTSVTPGTASEGSWTQIGSALTKPHWFWQVGMGINDSTTSNAVTHLDVGLGDASNKKVVISNHPWRTTGGEDATANMGMYWGDGATGDIVYARAQTSSADSNYSVAVYAVGG